MSRPSLVVLRAWELVDELVAAVGGVSAPLAERAVVRVLRAQALWWGNAVAYPPIAVLYLPREAYQRLATVLEAGLPAMERRVAERLDPDGTASVRIQVRPHGGARRRLWVAAPRVRNHVPVHRPEHAAPVPTMPYPPEGGLALRSQAAGQTFAVPTGGLVLGRGGHGPGRVLDPRVSRHHTRIRPVDADRLRCEDLNSRNGTWVDGARITQPVQLRAGQLLRIGDTEFRIVREGLNGGNG
ncbi:FHA domain-containing protein [Dactylosporangium sp. NPDC051484]|uniref:FHA domain-containing protein n=1 Tax=Dactylosporangium sp. NPDC051484 TaxID=3154942 RepID=UPI00344B0134